MSRWLGLLTIILICLVITGAYWQGYYQRKAQEDVENAKATQAQLDEQREIQNAVNKLDDTGLRDTILGVQ